MYLVGSLVWKLGSLGCCISFVSGEDVLVVSGEGVSVVSGEGVSVVSGEGASAVTGKGVSFNSGECVSVVSRECSSDPSSVMISVIIFKILELAMSLNSKLSSIMQSKGLHPHSL